MFGVSDDLRAERDEARRLAEKHRDKVARLYALAVHPDSNEYPWVTRANREFVENKYIEENRFPWE